MNPFLHCKKYSFSQRRIRDNLGDSRVQTRVKQIDAFTFTLGVAGTYLTEWIILRKQHLFPVYFYILMTGLLINR